MDATAPMDAAAAEDAAWTSLAQLLREAASGEELARQLMADKRATPKELLSMAAVNADKADSWELRRRFMDVARVAVESGAVLDVCHETRMLFRALTRYLAHEVWDCDECVLVLHSLVDCLVEGWRHTGQTKAMAREASVLLLNALVDPIALRVQPSDAARRVCAYIADALMYEFKQATHQTLLLHRARPQRGERPGNNEGEEEEGDTSPAEMWDGETEDSETPSSDASGVGSELTVPPLASATLCWAMATTPGALDFLTPAGRLAWVHAKARVFMDRRDSLLVAGRGLETLLGALPADIGSRSPAFCEELCTTLASALACAAASQRASAHDAFAAIARGIEPASARVDLLHDLVVHRVPPHSPARAYLIDLLRRDAGEPAALRAAEAVLAEPELDVDAACAALSLVRVAGAARKLPLRARILEALARVADEDAAAPGDFMELRPPRSHDDDDDDDKDAMRAPRPFPAPAEPASKGDVRAGKLALLRFAARGALEVCEE